MKTDIRLDAHSYDIGWLFIYISAFGLSDMFISHFLKSHWNRGLYFCIVGIFGLFFL